MGALVAGLLGAAGRDIEQKEQRQYEESKAERDRKRRLIEFAAETAINKGAYNMLPEIFSEMDDVGAPSNVPKGVKDPFRQMGGALGKLLHLRQRQQQQQVPGATGQMVPGQSPVIPGQTPGTTPPFVAPGSNFPTAQGGLGAPIGRQTAPMPESRAQNVWERLGPSIQKAETEREEAAFQTGRKRADIEYGDVTERELKKVDRLTQELVKRGLKQDDARNEAERIVYGKAVAPTGQKFAPFFIGGDKIPQDIQNDALGNPIDRTGAVQYKLDETSRQFYPASAAPRGGVTDEAAKWAKVLMQGNPRLTPEQATQMAAERLGWNKLYAPAERLQLQADTVRQIVGEKGILQLPTHVRGAGPGVGAPGGAGRATSVPLPATRLRQSATGATGTSPASGTGPTAVPGVPGGRIIPFGEWQPRLPAAERTAVDTAHGVAESALRAAKEIPKLQKERPGSFGTFAGRVTSARMPPEKGEMGIPFVAGTAPPEFAGVGTDIHSVAAFLTGVHRARGVGYANLWAGVLGNPWVNPGFTVEALKRAAQIAEAVAKEAAKPSKQGFTEAEIIADLQRTNPKIFESLDEQPGGGGRGTTEMPKTRQNPYRTGAQ